MTRKHRLVALGLFLLLVAMAAPAFAGGGAKGFFDSLGFFVAVIVGGLGVLAFIVIANTNAPGRFATASDLLGRRPWTCLFVGLVNFGLAVFVFAIPNPLFKIVGSCFLAWAFVHGLGATGLRLGEGLYERMDAVPRTEVHQLVAGSAIIVLTNLVFIVGTIYTFYKVIQGLGAIVIARLKGWAGSKDTDLEDTVILPAREESESASSAD